MKLGKKTFIGLYCTDWKLAEGPSAKIVDVAVI